MVSGILLCVSCDLAVQQGIYNKDFLGIMLKIIIPPVVFMIPLIYLYFRSENQTPSLDHYQQPKWIPVAVFSLIIGIGMGGFVDGILLHQLLQWHQMISNQLEPVDLTSKNINMFWDGIFHVITWTATLTGILFMWRSRKNSHLNLSNWLFAGGLIAGWGIFNFIDSIFNHYLFGFHNVRENVVGIEWWNLGFLIVAVLLILIGGLMMWKGKNIHAKIQM